MQVFVQNKQMMIHIHTFSRKNNTHILTSYLFFLVHISHREEIYFCKYPTTLLSFFPNIAREIRSPLTSKSSQGQESATSARNEPSSMNVLWVPNTWEWVHWWLNKKPQVCMVNTENWDFARMDRTFQF